MLHYEFCKRLGYVNFRVSEMKYSPPILCAALLPLALALPNVSVPESSLPDREKMEVGGSSFWQSVIPVAANSPGRFGAHFKTRVVISNPTTRDYSIAAHLYGKDGPIRQVRIPINAEKYYVWDNFLEEVFDYRGSGSVWLAASDREVEFYVTAEVYTDSPNGRFSTTVVNGIAPAYVEGHGTEYNFGISVNESRRTNIGVWNWELEPSSIEAQVFDAFGTLVQTIAFELNAEAWQQKSISASVDNGFVRWNINGESEAHYFYAVEVDNASNDGTLNWSVKGPKSIASGGGDSSIVLRVDFDATERGEYTATAFHSDWPSVEWVTGLGTDRAEIIGGASAYSGHSLRLKYPAHTYGSRNQAIQAQIRLPRNYEELYVSYRVRFAGDFDFVRGGKLPGLTGGAGNTGGNRPNGRDGWSGRMMWRRGGEAVQYLYHPDQPQTYGEDFNWGRRFKPGRWHTVEHRFVMNTPGKNDGVLQTWFDGTQALYVDNLRFRDIDSFAIDHFYISTFFGGGDSTWAPTKDEYISFDDFFVSTTRIQQ